MTSLLSPNFFFLTLCCLRLPGICEAQSTVTTENTCTYSFLVPTDTNVSGCSGLGTTQQQQQLQDVQASVKKLQDQMAAVLQIITAPKNQTQTISCPSDFYYFSTINRCYKPVAEALTWVAAGQRCRQINSKAHLVVIENDLQQQMAALTVVTLSGAEQAMCATLIPNIPPTGGYWTSGQRINPAANTSFVWKPDPSSLSFKSLVYTNWNAGQPDFAGGVESCLHIWLQLGMRWNDYICASTLCAICEIDMV